MTSNHKSSTDPEFQLDAQPAVAAFVSGRRKFLDFICTRVSDPADAEEILQRASVKILERGTDLRQSASAEAWIYRLLRNELVDYYRRTALQSKKTVELPSDFDMPAPLEPASEARPCPCAAIEMTALIPDYEDALRSLEMEDETVSSYAARKGISVNNAGVRLHRARKALRNKVEARCGSCAGAGCFSCSCSS